MTARRLFAALALISVCTGFKRSFPKDFLFGVATSSYQIEGGWNASGKGVNIWDTIMHTNKKLVLDGTTGDLACDSYNLHERDVEMLTELGVNFYRFSLSWSRILPTGFAVQINDDGLNYYNTLIDNLLAANITPVVTIYHWDLPQPLQELGGWTNPLMAEYFADYANVVFEQFGDRVKTWLTFNEPFVFCKQGYGDVAKAPALNMTGIAEYLCGHTMLKAHAKAYHLYDDVFRFTQMGRISLTLSGQWYERDTDTQEDTEAAQTAIFFELGWYSHPIFSKEGDYPKVMKENIAKRSREQGYPKSRLPEFTPNEIKYIRGTYDFFGLNHYTTYNVKARTSENVTKHPSLDDDRGVDIYQDAAWLSSQSTWLKVIPWGFKSVLNWIRYQYDNPEVMVFENGFSDNGTLDDQDRINFHNLYLNAMLDAIENKCKVTAYTVWSLMDNMEWFRGYTEHFGLYYIDFDGTDRTRTPKSSAFYYADIIKNRTIESVHNKYEDDFDISFLV